jgi:hypothetical protein
MRLIQQRAPLLAAMTRQPLVGRLATHAKLFGHLVNRTLQFLDPMNHRQTLL